MRDLHDVRHEIRTEVEAPVTDAGLRRFMLGIYNKVAAGLLLASGAAYATAHVPALRDLLFRTVPADGAQHVTLTLPGIATAFAPIVLLLWATPSLARPTAARTGALYWSVVALVGASMGLLLLTYTGVSIALTLAITATAFGGLSLAGYTTRRSLSAFGGFLTMGLIGLVLTLGANLLLHSAAIGFVAGAAGVLIFAGLIAYDTQRLKLVYRQLGGDAGSMAVATDLGALSLFINFLNLFQLLLAMLSGERR